MKSQKLNTLQRYSGVAGVMVLWTGVSLAMLVTGLGLIDSRPISYLGIDPLSKMLFASSLLISAFLFINFGFYVKRTFKVINRFMTYFLIGQFCQVVVALVPYRMGYSRSIHTVAAFALAITLPLLIRAFARSQASSPHRRLYVRLLRFEQITFVIGMGLFIFTKGIAPLGEALPAAGFHVWIIAVTIIAHNTGSRN